MAKSDYFVDYVDDWADRLRRRLYAQWFYSVSWNKWPTFLGQMSQDLEDAFQSLFSLPSIDNSEGVNLDVIGRIVGQPRTVEDSIYRRFLKARIGVNRSDGTATALYRIFRGLFGEAVSLIIRTDQLGPHSPGINGWKFFTLISNGPVDAVVGNAGVAFLRDAKETGAGANLGWAQGDDSDMFCFDGGTGLGFDDETGNVGGQLAIEVRA